MTFIHTPSAVTIAIGAGTVMLELWRDHRGATSRRREELAREFAKVRLRSGSLLDGLEQVGLVAVERDALGEVATVTWCADESVVFPAAVDLVVADRRDRW
jgi:hypothetical protein